MRQIMIVDDSPTDSHLLKKMLERNGFNTLTAADAGEGIEVALRQKPDLTTWPDYAMYHEPLEKVEKLGRRLLEDYTRRYGSTRTPVVPQ